MATESVKMDLFIGDNEVEEFDVVQERFLDSVELDNTKKKLVKKSSRLYMSTSFSFNRKIEDASALAHYVGTGFVSKEPDEKQFQVVGLSTPTMKKNVNRSRKWSF